MDQSEIINALSILIAHHIGLVTLSKHAQVCAIDVLGAHIQKLSQQRLARQNPPLQGKNAKDMTLKDASFLVEQLSTQEAECGVIYKALGMIRHSEFTREPYLSDGNPEGIFAALQPHNAKAYERGGFEPKHVQLGFEPTNPELERDILKAQAKLDKDVAINPSKVQVDRPGTPEDQRILSLLNDLLYLVSTEETSSAGTIALVLGKTTYVLKDRRDSTGVIPTDAFIRRSWNLLP